MQTRECVYCGAMQDHSTHQCPHCGGLVKQTTGKKLKPIHKKTFFVFLLSTTLIVAVSFFSYKNDMPNTAVATHSVQTFITEPGAEIPRSTVNHFAMKAKFTQALMELSSIKMLVVEHYHMFGQYPASLSELGFNEKSFDTGEYIKAIQFSKQGVIQASLAAKIFGDNKVLILTPKATMGGMNMHWKCTGNLEQHIILGICEPTI